MKNLLIILLLFALSSLRFAQRRDYHVTVQRGDYKELIFRHSGDVDSTDLSFVVKLTRGFSSPRLIEKKNTFAGGDTNQVKAVYTSPYTTITVKLLQADTYDLTAQKYFYDIVSDSTTLFDGEFRNVYDVQTPFDGTAIPPTPFWVAGTFIDGATEDSSLFRYDEATQTIVPISKEDVWNFLNVSDTVQTYVADLQSELDSIIDANSYYSLTFNYPIGGEILYIEKTDFPFTIDSVRAETRDSAITFNLAFASDWDAAQTMIFPSSNVVTSTHAYTSFANATIPKNNYLVFVMGSVAGIYGEVLSLKIYYR